MNSAPSTIPTELREKFRTFLSQEERAAFQLGFRRIRTSVVDEFRQNLSSKERRHFGAYQRWRQREKSGYVLPLDILRIMTGESFTDLSTEQRLQVESRVSSTAPTFNHTLPYTSRMHVYRQFLALKRQDRLTSQMKKVRVTSFASPKRKRFALLYQTVLDESGRRVCRKKAHNAAQKMQTNERVEFVAFCRKMMASRRPSPKKWRTGAALSPSSVWTVWHHRSTYYALCEAQSGSVQFASNMTNADVLDVLFVASMVGASGGGGAGFTPLRFYEMTPATTAIPSYFSCQDARVVSALRVRDVLCRLSLVEAA